MRPIVCQGVRDASKIGYCLKLNLWKLNSLQLISGTQLQISHSSCFYWLAEYFLWTVNLFLLLVKSNQCFIFPTWLRGAILFGLSLLIAKIPSLWCGAKSVHEVLFLHFTQAAYWLHFVPLRLSLVKSVQAAPLLWLISNHIYKLVLGHSPYRHQKPQNTSAVPSIFS